MAQLDSAIRRHAVAAMFLVAMVALLAGCDSFSSLTVNCQVGLKNDGSEVAGCQFSNAGRSEAQSCVKVHVIKSEDEALAGQPAGEARTFVSNPLCSGPVAPGQITDPAELAFADATPRTVAEACVRNVEGERQFQCQFKIEEVAKP